MSGALRSALERSLDPAAIEAKAGEVRVALKQAAGSGKLVVIGSARLPEKVVHAVRAAGGDVAALVEFAPRFWGREVAGLPVTSLGEALMQVGEDPVALVGIWSPNHIYAETRAWLEAAGVRRVLPVNAAFWAHADELGAWYQFGDPSLYGAHAGDILTVFDALSDEESKRQFAGILQYRVTLEPAHIPLPSYRRIYFDPAIATLPDDAVIADIGAFSGDTLEVFLYWQGTRFSRFVAFEPDPMSFAKLEAYRASLPQGIRDKVECVHAAAGAAPGTLRFSATGTPGTKATDEGEVEVPCLTVDAFFNGKPLDYIKVDVEGAEPEVLAGAWKTIERTRPVIGLSIYHAPEDVFTLPLHLIQRLKGYAFHVRAHDHDGIDFIVYAVPVEKSAHRPARPPPEDRAAR